MIMVDDSSANDRKFGYINKDEEVEFVQVGENTCVYITNSYNQFVDIYKQDIPKLILALQAAQEHIEKNKEEA